MWLVWDFGDLELLDLWLWEPMLGLGGLEEGWRGVVSCGLSLAYLTGVVLVVGPGLEEY